VTPPSSRLRGDSRLNEKNESTSHGPVRALARQGLLVRSPEAVVAARPTRPRPATATASGLPVRGAYWTGPVFATRERVWSVQHTTALGAANAPFSCMHREELAMPKRPFPQPRRAPRLEVPSCHG